MRPFLSVLTPASDAENLRSPGTGSKALLLLLLGAGTCFGQQPWKRHVIDNTSRGADGVRLAGKDIVTGWEEGGVVRIYRYPGPKAAKQPWPAETIGRVGSPEDAVWKDLDGDGALDVISASEGSTRALHVHWAPDWKTEPVPSSVGRMQWMFSEPLDAGRLISGGKNENAALGIWKIPAKSRDLNRWEWLPLRSVGWIMSILARDMDKDGDLDILFSDRRGSRSGVFWLEAPSWKEHAIGSLGREVMFVTNYGQDVIAAVKPREIHWHRRMGDAWQTTVIAMPAGTGTAKAVRVADLDGDGKPEILFSCEQTPEGRSGVMGMRESNGKWEPFPISGWPGVKYDLIELLDLDEDGDLDVITCEEVSNLGVIWFENPAR